jgi:hypothetical protein
MSTATASPAAAIIAILRVNATVLSPTADDYNDAIRAATSPAPGPPSRSIPGLTRDDLYAMARAKAAEGLKVLVIDPVAPALPELYEDEYVRLPSLHNAIPVMRRWADLVIRLAAPAS